MSKFGRAACIPNISVAPNEGPPKELSGGLFFGVTRGLIQQLDERIQLLFQSSRSVQECLGGSIQKRNVKVSWMVVDGVDYEWLNG